MMLYKLLADGVVFIHLAYVGFVVVAQLLLLVGLLARWQWVRNFRFRVVHLVMVEVVALEGYFGIICPMTEWDGQLRSYAQGDDKVAAVQQVQPAPAQPTPLDPAPAKPPTVDPGPMQPAPMQPAPMNPTNVPEPAPARLPEPADEPAAPESESTFVGQLLSSILYLEVPQRELDRWYVRFGLVTLTLFLLFPPRLGCWSWCGVAAVTIIWTGGLFTCAAIHELMTHPLPTLADGTSIPAPSGRYTPLEFGIWMTLLGVACWWRCLTSQTNHGEHGEKKAGTPCS